ncbi:unnamed protein product [Rotaria sp. Silwood2]|nr:unnamed protein product [Rotaria sp. Silwood2]
MCPSSYFGERCENQRERISIVLHVVSSPKFQRNNAIKVILYLVDTASQQILADEEILHFPYVHSSYKHLVLLSSDRAPHSFVRIDTYEVDMKQVIGYRASWKYDLPFPFLPVRRLAIRLVLSDNNSFSARTGFKCHTCIHGQCSPYQNSDDVFCQCYDGWTGIGCNESFICASGAMPIHSNRCVCPMSRYGTRCFISNLAICQCRNGGTCILLDARAGQSACLCSENYFGQYCERQHASLKITTFDKYQPEILPIVLIQFIQFHESDYTYFESTILFERISTIRALSIYHIDHESLPPMVISKIFYSSSAEDYAYYIILQVPLLIFRKDFQLKYVETQLETRQKCSDVRKMKIFKTPINILTYPYIKRIKYYLRVCFQNNITCFHDEIYFCSCPTQKNHTVMCKIYDHNREKCQTSSYCLNGGLCIENRRKGIVEFACLCISCHYYGSLCQFSTGQQGLSLDALIGVEMRTGKTLSKQSILIKMSLTILTCMITLGFIGNILCAITFVRKKSREVGCGYYLFLISIYNQLALILLGLRFVYLLITQMILSNNRIQLLFLCQCLEFGLTLFPNLSNWLSACVSVERTYVVSYGTFFSRKKSVRAAKLLCIILLIVLGGMTVHEPMTRYLIEDPRLGRYT